MHRFPEDARCAGGALEEREAEIPIVFQLVGPSVRSSVGWMPRERAVAFQPELSTESPSSMELKCIVRLTKT